GLPPIAQRRRGGGIRVGLAIQDKAHDVVWVARIKRGLLRRIDDVVRRRDDARDLVDDGGIVPESAKGVERRHRASSSGWSLERKGAEHVTERLARNRAHAYHPCP